MPSPYNSHHSDVALSARNWIRVSHLNGQTDAPNFIVASLSVAARPSCVRLAAAVELRWERPAAVRCDAGPAIMGDHSSGVNRRSGFLLPEVVYGWEDLRFVAAGGTVQDVSAEARVVPSVTLRAVRDADLPVLFEHQRDPEATEMAAFPARDWPAFTAHWAKIRADPMCVTQAILVDGAIAGNIGSWEQDGRREVGYWLGRDFWGRGIATTALSMFLHLVTERPLHAWVVAHNRASLRVVEKCGFQIVGTDDDVSADGAPVTGVILTF
jgi:RimJ/RimL family protein N-acetyltransferase